MRTLVFHTSRPENLCLPKADLIMNPKGTYLELALRYAQTPDGCMYFSGVDSLTKTRWWKGKRHIKKENHDTFAMCSRKVHVRTRTTACLRHAWQMFSFIVNFYSIL